MHGGDLWEMSPETVLALMKSLESSDRDRHRTNIKCKNQTYKLIGDYKI